MTIQAKRIAAGILAESRVVGLGQFTRLSNSSDWFESRAGTSPEHANHLVLSILVESATLTASSSEELAIDLFDSFAPDALVGWNHIASLVGPSTANHIFGPGLYEFLYPYPTTPPTNPYLRLQFSIDDEMAAGNLVPYPASGSQFTGTCWVSMTHL